MAEASSSSATIHSIRMHPYGERYHIVPWQRWPAPASAFISQLQAKVPQAASSLAVPPEPPAERKQSSERRDRLVHGSAGRAHQLATLPSS